MAERGLTLGTAGHIDHGKTALVEALTGENTDRLAEEHRRGISIELGFAELALPDGQRLSVVDVPGHERFVRMMVAGAAGIDLFLLVVASDDGPMPQTYEHLAVLRALEIERGVVAITKCDLASHDRLAALTGEVHDLAPGASVIPVSAHTGQGLSALRAELGSLAAEARHAHAPSHWPEPAILHIDRAFTLKGIGTVVTGTLRSGQIEAGDRVALLPRGTEARVRSVQTHDRGVPSALAGRRVALNLAGIRRDEVERGDVVATPGSSITASYRLDVTLRLETRARLVDRQRVQVHHGTRSVAARLIELSAGLAQLRLEAPLVAQARDRIVIRSIAPPDTLGGATVIDPHPSRHGPAAAAQVRLIADGDPEELLVAAFSDHPEKFERNPATWEIEDLVGPALRRFSPQRWRNAAARVRARLVPTPGLDQPQPAPTEPGPIAQAALKLLLADGVRPRAPQAIADALGVSRRHARGGLDELASTGLAVCLKPGIYFCSEVLDRIRDETIAQANRSGSVSIAELRDSLGTSRRHAQALLEHFDAARLMIRRGDRHFLRRACRG